jgi:hypothetical protein
MKIFTEEGEVRGESARGCVGESFGCDFAEGIRCGGTEIFVRVGEGLLQLRDHGGCLLAENTEQTEGGELHGAVSGQQALFPQRNGKPWLKLEASEGIKDGPASTFSQCWQASSLSGLEK